MDCECSNRSSFNIMDWRLMYFSEDFLKFGFEISELFL